MQRMHSSDSSTRAVRRERVPAFGLVVFAAFGFAAFAGTGFGTLSNFFTAIGAGYAVEWQSSLAEWMEASDNFALGT